MRAIVFSLLVLGSPDLTGLADAEALDGALTED
jgi:hypothetical protein